jgi:hypothetical protein
LHRKFLQLMEHWSQCFPWHCLIFWRDEQSIDYTIMVCNMMQCQWLACGILHVVYIFIFPAGPPPPTPSPTIKFQTFWVCTLLGHYAAYSGNSLLTFRDNQSVPKHR